VSRIKVIYDDKIIYDRNVSAYHFTDEIDFNEQGITDRELIFEFYNNKNELLKWESIMILTTKNKIELPKINLAFNSTDLSKVKSLKTIYTITNDTVFTLNNTIKYVYSHHEGWNPGVHKEKVIATDKSEVVFSDVFEFSEKCYVLNVGAGIDVSYGKFVKRIHNEKLLYRGNWADPIRVNN